jgi:SARP family transcriptional regulator, regulator of embCAB operon
MRIYVTGRIAVEHEGAVLDESRFPSRQARLVFAALVTERARALSREELAHILWQESLPPRWDSALKSLVSKLRGLCDGFSVDSTYGCYRALLPRESWVDVEAARRAIDEAEGAIRAGRDRAAWGPTNVAIAIAKRGFLPGERGSWVETRRREIDELCLRAMDAYGELCLRISQPEGTIQICEEMLGREPYRESGYQRLMLAHAARGNRAEALRIFHRCRELLRDELGCDPAPETSAVYLRLLRDPS